MSDKDSLQTMLNIQVDRALPIYTIRGVEVMLDQDLASLYGVETRSLVQSVKRNLERFPVDFMFKLEIHEFENLISQIVTSRSGHGGRRNLPVVFTEQGVAMLTSVLNSPQAITANIQIMRAFVALKHETQTYFDEQMAIALHNDAAYDRLDLAHQNLVAEHRNVANIACYRLMRLRAAEAEYHQLKQIERQQRQVILRVERWITGMEEFGALMVATRLRTVDALVLGYLLRRCTLWDSQRLVWIEATVPQITCSLNWPSIRQVEGALRRLAGSGLIQRDKRGPRKIFYLARTDDVIARIRAISGDVSTPEGLVAVSDSLSPLARALRDLIPLTANDTPDIEVERIRRLRGDDGETPRVPPWLNDAPRTVH